MHFRSNSGISGFLLALIVLIVIIFGFVVIVLLQSLFIPTIQVSNVSLYPSEMMVGDHATLSFTIKNNDAANQHNIRVTFNVTSVTFYLNDMPLDKDIYSVQYYNILLQSSARSTYSFRVTAVLTGGASTTTYSIRLCFYDERGIELDSSVQSLTVNS